jgi:hypothetical protein
MGQHRIPRASSILMPTSFRMKTPFRFFSAVAMIAFSGVVSSTTPLVAQQINTGSSGTDAGIWPFGANNTATYGQTFTVPVGLSQLNQFTFQLYAGGNGSALDFYGFLMGWSGDRAAGPVLYQSALQHGTDNFSPVTYTFNTGGINLSSGSMYVAFLNASEFIAANPDATAWDHLPSGVNGFSDSYSGGNFNFFNNGGDFSLLTSEPWENFSVGGFGEMDAAFTATFSDAVATPEPASLALLATGLVGVFGAAGRRRKAASAA